MQKNIEAIEAAARANAEATETFRTLFQGQRFILNTFSADNVYRVAAVFNNEAVLTNDIAVVRLTFSEMRALATHNPMQ